MLKIKHYNNNMIIIMIKQNNGQAKQNQQHHMRSLFLESRGRKHADSITHLTLLGQQV